MITLSSRFARGIALAFLLAATGCSNLQKPGPQSIVGMSPVGTVSLTEIIAVGAAGGQGVLHFQGQSYQFNLQNVSDFKGLYTQSSGAAGLDNSTTSDLWLRNRAGVVLHLTGTQTGMTLSLGREEILIEMI